MDCRRYLRFLTDALGLPQYRAPTGTGESHRLRERRTFVTTHLAPNRTVWASCLQSAGPPVIGPHGFVEGPWGDCITAACLFEANNPEWPSLPEYVDGPAGQVLEFLCSCGHGSFQEALERTEEATHRAIEHGEPLPVFGQAALQARFPTLAQVHASLGPGFPSSRAAPQEAAAAQVQASLGPGFPSSIAAPQEAAVPQFHASLGPAFPSSIAAPQEAAAPQVQASPIDEHLIQALAKADPSVVHISHEFNCPITQELMRDPVIAADGHSYDRSAIQQWFVTGRCTSPVTNAPLPSQSLVPNFALRSQILRAAEEAARG